MTMQDAGGQDACSDVLRFVGSLSGSLIRVSNISAMNFANTEEYRLLGC
jgi:hypothetical protein